MPAFLNYIIIIVCLVIACKRFSRNYEDGLPFVAGMLAFLPDDIAIDIHPSLPLITLSRILIITMIIYWWKNPRIRREMTQAPLYKIQLALVIFFLISNVASAWPLVSIKRLFYYLLESFALFIVVQSSLTDRKLAARVINAIGYGLLVVALIGFAERFAGVELTAGTTGGGRYEGAADRFSWVPPNPYDYIHSTYLHRILFGVACALGAAKFLIDGVVAKEKKTFIKSLVMCFICGSSLFFSNSRGPWLAFAICGFVLVVLFPKYFVKKGAVLGLVVVAVLLLRPGIWTTISGIAESTMDEDSFRGGSFRWRKIVWQTSVEHIESSDPFHFLFGYGGGSQIMTDFGTAELHPGLNLPLVSWDCELAIILYERGALGFACFFLLFMIGIVQATLYLLRNRGNLDPTMTWVLASLLILFFMNANVAMFAPQLTFITSFVFAIESKLLATAGFRQQSAQPAEVVYAA